MTCLFLDTSSSYLTLGLLVDKKLIDSNYVYLGSDMSKSTLLYIGRILKDNNLKATAIDEIICVNGPGSYTGIRIGVTIAKTYAYTLNKKVIPVSSLYAMAASVKEYDFIIPVIDARRSCVFAGIYNKDLEMIMADKYIPIKDLQKEVNSLKGTYAYVSIENIKDIDSIIYKPDIENVIRNITKSPVNPHFLVPTYLKRTEAEENLGV